MKRTTLALMACTVLTVLFSACGAAARRTTPAAQANPFKNHPTATGIGAGMVAHHMAKHAHGGMMHRHPVMTGVGAGMVAHHMAKKH